MKIMKKQVAELIEQKHNVTVDRESGMYTNGDPEDNYGWAPVPNEWQIEAADEYATS